MYRIDLDCVTQLELRTSGVDFGGFIEALVMNETHIFSHNISGSELGSCSVKY